MKKKGQDLRDVVGDTTHDLANMGKHAARDLADYVVPRLRAFADDVTEYAEPRARDLSRRGLEFAAEKRETLEPKVRAFAADARDTIEPKVQRLAADTRVKAQPYLTDAKKLAQPKLDTAKKRVQPLVDTGRDRFDADIRPRLEEAIATVNAQPQTKEAKKRLAAATAALAGELALPESKTVAKRSKRKTFGQIVLAGGLGAGVVYAIKRFLAPEDSGWQAHEPSQAYQTREDFLTESDTEQADAPAKASDPDSADPFVVSPYGEGSYVGSEPPADYTIKGNERSMKYHVVGSGGYDRTIADVWFTSEEVAEAAGFSKAQR